jgi:hypothetical protein
MSNLPIPGSPSTHEDNAQAIRAELTRLVQGIPGLTLLTPERRRKITVSGHVDEDFLRSMALLLDAHPDVAAMCEITSAEIRNHLSFYGSHLGVGEELMLYGRKMIDTILGDRSSIGERTLRALRIARNLNTPAGSEALVPHLETIDREFTRGRRKRGSRKPGDAPAGAKPSEVKS